MRESRTAMKVIEEFEGLGGFGDRTVYVALKHGGLVRHSSSL